MKQKLVLIHRWLAFVIALPLLYLSITGVLLAFADEVERIFYPELRTVAPRAEPFADEVWARVLEWEAKDDGYRVLALTFPASAYDSAEITALSPDGSLSSIFLNPYDGAVLGEKRHDQRWGGRLLELHRALSTTIAGSAALAWIACLGAVVVIALGVVLALQSGVVYAGWHSALGALIAPVVLVVSSSAVLLLATGRPNPPVTAVPAEPKFAELDLPSFADPCEGPPHSVWGAQAGGLRLECADGRRFTLSKTRWQTSGESELSVRLHTGTWAGFAGRAVWMWCVAIFAGVIVLGFSRLSQGRRQ